MARGDLARAAVLITALALVSKFLGFGREMIFAAFYGASGVMDAYVVANMLPAVLGAVVQQGIVTAFIPVYNTYLARGDQRDADRLANTVVVLVVVCTGLIGAAAYVFMPYLVAAVAPGFAPPRLALTVRLTRIMLPILLLSGLLGLANAVQQAHKRFFYPALVGLPYNIVIISGVALLASRWGIYAAAVATTLAVVAQVCIQWPGLKSVGFRLRPALDLGHPGVRRMAALILPVLFGTAANHANLFVDRMLASSLPAGSIAALTYASRVNAVCIGLFVTSVITVIFPTLAQCAARQDMAAFKRHLNVSIRVIAFIIIPIMVIFLVFSKPIIAAAFQRGVFDNHATDLTSFALFFFALGMLGISLIDLLNQAFYAQQDTRTPVLVTFGVVAVNIILNFLLVKPLAHGGLALATSTASTLGMLVLLYLLRRRLGSIGGRQIMISLAKILAASCAMVLVAYGIFALLAAPGLRVPGLPAGLTRLVPLGLALSAGGLAYLTAAAALRCQELAIGLELAARKIPFLRRFTV